jgi:hypothetical protein
MALSRLFYSPGDATRAVHDLVEVGFTEDFIHVVNTPVPVASLIDLGISPAHAKIYAEDIANGGTLVLVKAPLGSAALATEILEAISPTNSGEPQVRWEGLTWDDSTAISSLFGWPSLLKDATPLSSYFGWPLLSSAGPKEKWFGLSLLATDFRPMSLMMGLGLLTKRDFMLSDLFGWPLKLKK